MTLIAEFRTSNTRTLRSDDATVDVLGMCIYASPLDDRVYCALLILRDNYIHIGVGSDVVCSILMGNARASVRGTDSETTHAFFMS